MFMQEMRSKLAPRPSHSKPRLGFLEQGQQGAMRSFKLSSLVGAEQRPGGWQGEGCCRWAKAQGPGPRYPHFPVPKQEIMSVRLLHAARVPPSARPASSRTAEVPRGWESFGAGAFTADADPDLLVAPSLAGGYLVTY